MPFNHSGAGDALTPRGAGFVFPAPDAGDVSPPHDAGDVSPLASPNSLLWDSISDSSAETVPLSPRSMSDFETPPEEQDRRNHSTMLYILPNGHYVSILIN